MSSSSLPPLFDAFPPTSTDEWAAKIREDLGDTNPGDVLEWTSVEGISLSALLRREDLDSVAHVSEDASAPPLADPSTPGPPWRVRQDIGHPDPATANDLAHAAVDGGCTDLGLALRQTSRPGLSITTVDDLATVLADLPTDAALHLDRGPAAVVAARALRHTSASPPSLASIGFDPVASLATGLLSDAEAGFDCAATLCTSPPSDARTISVDLRPYHDAGASAVQELAFGLGALSETLHRLTERGTSLSSLLPRLHVQTAVSTSYVVEIAKLRALRLLVPQVLDAYADANAPTLAPADVFVQAETSRRTATLFDPYVNMLRGTTEAMAAVLGGCDVLSVRPYDDGFRPPDRFGTRIARNVQLILREEAHFDLVDDPAAGAYYFETATDQLARRAWARFQGLESDGGMLAALRDGRVQSDVRTVRERRCADVDDRNQVLVGTNHYPSLGETRSEDVADGFFCNNGNEESNEPGSRLLDDLGDHIASDDPVHEAVGRSSERDAPGIEPLPAIRVAENIERLRLRTEHDSRPPPTVFLVPIGPPGWRSARATFARNVFGVAGFAVEEPLKFETPAEAAAAAAEITPAVVVLCSSDDEYPSLTPALRSALAEHDCSPLLVVAGNPDRIEADVPADDFIYSGRPLRDTLTGLQDRLGIPPMDADDA